MASTEAEKRASAKYDKENAIQVNLRLNKRTDADILAYIEEIRRSGGSIQGAFKDAIRDQMAKRGE